MAGKEPGVVEGAIKRHRARKKEDPPGAPKPVAPNDRYPTSTILPILKLSKEALNNMTKKDKITNFRQHIEKIYSYYPTGCGGSFDEILCYEFHDEPVNPRMDCKTLSDGYNTGLTFKELAKKWGISVTFLGHLIADHCNKL